MRSVQEGGGIGPTDAVVSGPSLLNSASVARNVGTRGFFHSLELSSFLLPGSASTREGINYESSCDTMTSLSEQPEQGTLPAFKQMTIQRTIYVWVLQRLAQFSRTTLDLIWSCHQLVYCRNAFGTHTKKHRTYIPVSQHTRMRSFTMRTLAKQIFMLLPTTPKPKCWEDTYSLTQRVTSSSSVPPGRIDQNEARVIKFMVFIDKK